MQKVYSQNYWLKKGNPQLGLSWSDIESSIKSSIQTEVDKIPGTLVSTLSSDLLKNPEVSTIAKDQAEKAALEASVSQLQTMKNDLAAQINALKADPMGYMKANPGKVAMVAGAGLGGLMILMLLLRGIRK